LFLEKRSEKNSAAPLHAQNGRPLSKIERISLEDEVKRTMQKITRLERTGGDPDLRQKYEARVDHILVEEFGLMPMYPKPKPKPPKPPPMSLGEKAQQDPKLRQQTITALAQAREVVRQAGQRQP
jgi:hypothetical protein